MKHSIQMSPDFLCILYTVTVHLLRLSFLEFVSAIHDDLSYARVLYFTKTLQ